MKTVAQAFYDEVVATLRGAIQEVDEISAPWVTEDLKDEIMANTRKNLAKVLSTSPKDFWDSQTEEVKHGYANV